MADNTLLNAGTGGDTIASDDILSVKYQRVKLIHGADGVNDGDVATGNPLPSRLYLGTTAVSGGAGAVDAGTQRATLASDDPAVVSLAILDDWDESDRCKVNPIVGQAGIAAGAGAVGVTVPRTTLASDDPAVVALQLIDDTVYASDAAISKVVGIGGQFDDTLPGTTTENSVRALRMSTRRELYTQLRDAAGNERGANVNASNQLSVSVDNTVTVGSHAVTNAGTFAVQESGGALTALQIIDDWDETDRCKVNLIVGQAGVAAGSGAAGVTVVRTVSATDDPGVTSLAIIDDWDETDRCKVNLIVGQAGVAAGSGAAGVTVVRTVSATDDPGVTSLAIMDDWDNAASDGCSVSGDVAHDAADAGEPVKLGHKAVDLGANPTDVAANDRTNWYSMRNGVPFVMGGAPFVKSQNLQVTDADGAQTDAAILTAAANVAIMVTALEVVADNANTVDVSVRIGFGTANTPAADADKVILFHPGIPAGSGIVKGSGSGIIGAGLSGEDLRITSEDPVTGSFSVTVTYFTLAIG